MAIQKVIKNLKSYQFKAIIYIIDKNIKNAIQITKNKLKI